jgi:purine-nucleoside phosphorylase
MSDHSSFSRLAEATQADPPHVGLVLGSGLGQVAARLEVRHRVPFAEIPGLVPTSVAGHRGQLILGSWLGRTVLLFCGRLHYYESADWRAVLASVNIGTQLGARNLVLTNAAGGIADGLHPGSLMVIRDHIQWFGPYCWRHVNNGPSPYSPPLRRLLQEAGRAQDIAIDEGIYAAVTGPCYETPAEIRALRACGADAVGMSTAREIQAANDAGLPCAAVSLITNRAAGLSNGPIHHQEVLRAAEAAVDRLTRLIEGFLRLL